MPRPPRVAFIIPMDKTADSAPPKQGRFVREPEAAPPPAEPPPRAAMPTIARRWPRTVPAKRVFPRG